MGKKIALLLLLFASCYVRAQSVAPPFWSEIKKFKSADSVQMPPTGAILFVGSSSFTRWQNVQQYFPDYTIVNRGFGGSQLTDVIRYFYDVILPYQPKQVVIYCGENDLAEGGSVKAQDVVLRFKTLYGMIRQNLPTAAIHFVSIKPSPSRKQFFPEFIKANAAIKSFLETQKNAGFINVYGAMLNASGEPMADIFVEDNLHMNAKGYQIWQKIMTPYLLK